MIPSLKEISIVVHLAEMIPRIAVFSVRASYLCILTHTVISCLTSEWADELKFPTISLTPSPFPSQGLIAPSSPPMRSEPSRSSQPTRRAPTSAKLTAEQRAKRDAAIVAALSPSPSTLLANVPPADTSIPGPSTPSASSKRRFSPSFHSRNTLASSTLSDDARARREAAIASGLSPPTLPSREISEGKHAAVQTDGTDWSSSAEDEEFDYSNEDVFGPMTANYPSIAMSDNEEPPDAREPAQKKFRGFIQNEESTPSRKSGATASQSVLGLDGQGSTRNVSGMLPTPPRDVRYAPNEDMDAQRDDLVTSSAQSGSKGKERERGGATQWDKIHDDLVRPPITSSCVIADKTLPSGEPVPSWSELPLPENI